MDMSGNVRVTWQWLLVLIVVKPQKIIKMIEKYFDKKKSRDIARGILLVVTLFLIYLNVQTINNNYNELFNLEVEKKNPKLNFGLNAFEVIEPSQELKLHREITFAVIQIMGYLMFAISLWVGYLQKEKIK